MFLRIVGSSAWSRLAKFDNNVKAEDESGKRIGLRVFQRTGALLGRYQIGGEGSGNGMGNGWQVKWSLEAWTILRDTAFFLLEEAMHHQRTQYALPP
jgi:hypothetical protein